MKKIKTAVFPVAGLGTRFLPITKVIAKEMLVVVDKPLIQYAVEEAKEAGIEKFIFVSSRGKNAIEDHFDDHNGDYLEVLFWLFTENFKDFLWGNAMIRTSIEKVMALLSPKMKDIVENLKKDINEEISGTSSSTPASKEKTSQ